MSPPTTSRTVDMRSRRSRSAEGAALLRAIGNLDRNPRLRNPDHLAVRFLTPAMRLRVECAPLRTLTLRVAIAHARR